MNTLLPYPNFIGTAKVLDSRRLGKQRAENLQIMQALLGKQITNTHSREPTGEFRLRFYDRNHEEIPIEDLDVFDVWYQESVPTTRLVPTPREDWRIEDYEAPSDEADRIRRMWQGYEHVLLLYQNAICDEWADRGHRDSCQDRTQFLYYNVKPRTFDGMPDWLGDEDFHRSHQSNLLRQHPVYYSQFFHDVLNDLPYLWPVLF